MTSLNADALETNRGGRLTAIQRNGLRSNSRGMRKAEFQFATIFTVIGLLVWFGPGPAKYANVKPLVGIAFLALAGALVVRAFLGADPLTRDLRSGHVESVEGAISKWTIQTGSSSLGSTSHVAQVGKVRVETGAAAYDALPGAGIVRLYYLPHSHHLVNFEVLADRPLPEGALTDVHVALKDARQAFIGSLTAGPVKEADARAELAAIGRAMTAGFSPDGTTAPPAAARDPRPLAEAILGSWTSPMLILLFAGDGSVTATLAGGMKRSGRWSVDASGKLVSDVTGGDGAADAWVSGDRLTIELNGQALTLQRGA